MMHGGRLPAETSRFFGRAHELAAVRGALGRSRLVTLTGPGGVGKTRLALQAAGELTADFPDGVFIADLSAARDAPGVARAVAAALGLPAPPRRRGQPEPGWPARQLRGRRLLLVLDTAEHVVDACAALADAVLRGGDGPALVVTSRQALDRPGEVVFRIEPLPVGDGPGDDPGRGSADAVRLLADRAAAAAPGFALTDANLPRVVRLCQLLDGLPLAIELAAPRLRAVGLDELLDLLPGQLRALTSGRRATAGDRSRSLEDSVGWSYRLCSAAERRLWTRLSVFEGGFDLAAAEAVCGPARPGDDAGVLGPLIGLVDKSVVLRAADSGGAARYRLLGIVREYGAARAAGPAAAGTERHRLHYARVAREFAAALIGPGQPGLIAALAPDEANLRLALARSLAAGDAGTAASLAVDCWPALVSVDRLAEAAARLSRLPEPAPPSAAVLTAALLAAQGDAAGAAALRAGRPAASPPDGAQRPAGQAGGRLPALVAEFGEAVAALRRGEFARCAARCDALTAGLPPGECLVRGWACWLSGVTRWCAGDRASADAALRAGLELLAPFGGELAVAQHLEAFGWLAAARGDGRRAARLQGAADRIWQRLAAAEGVRAPRFGLLLLDAERDQAERQAKDLLGEAGYAVEHAAGTALTAAAAVSEVLPDGTAGPALSPPPLLLSPPLPPWPMVPSPAGPADVRPAGALLAGAGGAAPPGGAGSAGSGSAGSGPAPADPAGGGVPWAADAAPVPADEARWGMLTAREREVAVLVADGLTNKDIAARLVVSKRTVDAHLEHILGKLGYGSRVQVAALASAARARERADPGDAGGRP